MADEIKERFDCARQARSRRSYWINEVFRLAMPWRQRIDGPVPKSRKDDDPDMVRFDSILEQVISDFASEVMQTFTPRNAPWLEFGVDKQIDQRFGGKLQEELRAYSDKAFDGIARSRFYANAQECYHDLSAGTCAMLIYDTLQANIGRVCLHVPLPQLLIDVGPHGLLDLRGREFPMKMRDFRATYPLARLPQALSSIRDKDTVTVLHGYYRNWANRGDEEWIGCIYVNKHKTFEESLVGAGSCPIVAARWRFDGENPWGVGPGWAGAPPTRALQEITALTLANLQKRVDPPFFYDDDGLVNLDDGIEPGVGIPRAVGSKMDVIESGGDFNVAWVERDELRQEVRRTHYQDQPHQEGKTPPTLGQWMDQRQNTNTRREGPANLFAEEWTTPIVQRFMWLDAQTGQQPQVNVGGSAFTVKPLTPVVKERDMEAVKITEALLQIALPALGPNAPLAIDIPRTIAALKATLGEKHIALNDPTDVTQMIAATATAGVGGGGAQNGQLARPNGALQ